MTRPPSHAEDALDALERRWRSGVAPVGVAAVEIAAVVVLEAPGVPPIPTASVTAAPLRALDQGKVPGAPGPPASQSTASASLTPAPQTTVWLTVAPPSAVQRPAPGPQTVPLLPGTLLSPPAAAGRSSVAQLSVPPPAQPSAPAPRPVFLWPVAPASLAVQTERMPATERPTADPAKVPEGNLRPGVPLTLLAGASPVDQAAPQPQPARAQSEAGTSPEDGNRGAQVPQAQLAFGATLTPLAAAPRVILADDPPAGGVPHSTQPAQPPAPCESSRAESGDGRTGDARNSDVRTLTPQNREPDPAPRLAAALGSSGTLAEHAGGFAPASETHASNGAASPRSTPSPAETPFHATAEAIRAAESSQPLAEPPRTWAAQGITVRIAQPDTPTVDLHVVQRAGQVQVAVRTPDPALQSSLRQNLPTLLNSLERAGYRSEMFAPREAAVYRASSSEMNAQDDGHQSRPDFAGRGSGGSSHGRQRQRDPQAKDWRTELEKHA